MDIRNCSLPKTIFVTIGLFFLFVPATTRAFGLNVWSQASPSYSTLIYYVAPVFANGFIYETGISDDVQGTTVYSNGSLYISYAKVNANGSIGSWSITTPESLSQTYGATAAANGYLYVIGGDTQQSGFSPAVNYAAINQSTGALGSWNSGSSLPQGLAYSAAFVANGYLYVVEGQNSAGGTNTIYYSLINPSTGALGEWNVTNAPKSSAHPSVTVSNGYLYLSGSSWTNGTTIDTTYHVYYAPLNTNGTIESWTMLPSSSYPPNQGSLVAANGVMYSEVTRGGSTATSSIQASTINSNGSFGAVWTPEPAPSAEGTVSYNNFVFSNSYLYTIYSWDMPASAIWFAKVISNCPTSISATSDGGGFHLFANLLNVLANAVSLNFCVSNASSNHYFIPAKTTAELQSFYNAANAGTLHGVSVFAP